MANEPKQVIVMKKIVGGLRTGKYCAQSAHASVGALLSIAQIKPDKIVIPLTDPFIREWCLSRFTKAVVYVNTDEELIELHNQAKSANLPTSLIRDAGLTEFHGVPTLTAVGIGPGDPEEIDKITGHLPLF